jgi:hypothetical protein
MPHKRRDRVDRDETNVPPIDYGPFKILKIFSQQKHAITIGVALDRNQKLDTREVGVRRPQTRYYFLIERVLGRQHNHVHGRDAARSIRPTIAPRRASDQIDLGLAFAYTWLATEKLLRPTQKVPRPDPLFRTHNDIDGTNENCAFPSIHRELESRFRGLFKACVIALCICLFFAIY